MARLTENGIAQSRICLQCWHEHSQLYLEDESHIIFDCASYSSQRADFLRELSEETNAKMIANSTSSDIKLSALLLPT
jgi:hypothetical protein